MDQALTYKGQYDQFYYKMSPLYMLLTLEKSTT